MPEEQNPMELDSPQFKAPFSQETNEFYSPDVTGKKRKSIGRRVSFASKAKVRHFKKENVDSDDQKENALAAKVEEEEDNVFLVSKPPMIKPEPIPSRNLSPHKDNDEEIEVKDPSRNSFSSYDSNEDAILAHKTFLEDMDMTNPVGGIIQAVSQTLTTIEEADSINTTMDLTTCIGGILKNIPRYAEESNSDSTIQMITSNNPITISSSAVVVEGEEKEESDCPRHAPDSPSSVDTMELTRAVGGIMQSLLQHQQPSSTDPTLTTIPQSKLSRPSPLAMETTISTQNEEEEEQAMGADAAVGDEMDMTVVLRDTIKVNTPNISNNRTETKPSPSPFKNYSPGRIIRLQRQRMLLDENNTSPMSVTFIGDVDAPKELGAGASPIPQRRAIDVVEDMDLTTELFNRYIDTSRLSEGNFTNSQQHLSQSQSSNQAAQNVPITPKSAASQNNLILPDLPESQPESPTISNFMPRASLRDFLQETGIRFLDSICSLKRRETTGRPRESEIVTSAKQLFVDCGLAHECDALDEACVSLDSLIRQVSETLKLQEEQFNHSPPLAYLQYRDPAEQQNVLSKLRTLKSIARLIAHQEWYQRRHPIQLRLNTVLEGNKVILDDRLSYLTNLTSRLDELIQQAEHKVNELKQNLTETRNKHKNICLTEEELSHVRQLEEIYADQGRRIEVANEEMTNLIKEEAELRSSIEKALKRRQELQQGVHSLKQQVDNTPELSPVQLDELRTSLALLQGVTGWKLIKINESESEASFSSTLHLQYTRDEVSVTLQMNKQTEEGKLIVQGVTLSSAKAKSRLMRHASRLIKIESINQPVLTVPQCLHYIGRRLDRLMHLDRQLNIVNVQCTVSIPSTESLSANTDSVPIALGFLHHLSHTKFDILLSLAPSPAISEPLWLTYSQFVPFAGRIAEHHVKDAVNLALNNRFFPIRRAVSSIVDIMDTLCDN